MAVPKKRTGKSAQAKRRANWKAKVPAITTCKSCNAVCPTHTVCPECGYYKQAAVSIKNENYVAPEAREKKAPAKKTTKAAAKPKAKKEEVKSEKVKTQEAETETVEAPVAEATKASTDETAEAPEVEAVEKTEEKAEEKE